MYIAKKEAEAGKLEGEIRALQNREKSLLNDGRIELNRSTVSIMLLALEARTVIYKAKNRKEIFYSPKIFFLFLRRKVSTGFRIRIQNCPDRFSSYCQYGLYGLALLSMEEELSIEN